MGCCSLRVEHITLHEEKDGKEYVVSFDFLGKDSIRYQNEVQVEKRVFKNLQLFMENKQDGDDLFDRLNVSYMLIVFILFSCSEDGVHILSYLEIKVTTFLFLPPDANSEQAFERVNGRAHCQGLPYVQCFPYSARATGVVNK